MINQNNNDVSEPGGSQTPGLSLCSPDTERRRARLYLGQRKWSLSVKYKKSAGRAGRAGAMSPRAARFWWLGSLAQASVGSTKFQTRFDPDVSVSLKGGSAAETGSSTL